MAALAKALGLPLVINKIDKYNTLPHRMIYQADAWHPLKNPWVELKLQNGYYSPKVTMIDKFSALSEMDFCEQSTVTNHNDPALEDIQQALQGQQKKYEACYQKLNLLYQAGELNDATMEMIYIKMLPKAMPMIAFHDHDEPLQTLSTFLLETISPCLGFRYAS